jgi:hypothetical protein
LARFAPLTGVAAVVLWVAGVIVAESDSPEDDAPGTELVAYLEDHEAEIFVGAGLFCLGSALFIWFLASLAAHFRRAGDDGRLATVMVSGGVATAATIALVSAPNVAGALAFDNADRVLSPETAETLTVLGDGFFVVAELLAVALLGAAARMILRTGAFPRWVGYVTALFTIGLLVLPIGWAFVVWGIPLWTVVLSIWVFVREREPRTLAGATG